MILSNDCYLRGTCKKCNSECATNNMFCQKLFRINKLYEEALLTKKQMSYIPLRPDADGTDRDKFLRLSEISNSIIAWVSAGKCLYLHSDVSGNGKTSWAVRFLQSYVGNIWSRSDMSCRCLFINVPKLLMELKDFSGTNEYINHIKDNIVSADIVVFDEIGTKPATQFEFDNLYSFINSRVDNGKSCVYTSNQTPEQLKLSVGERLYSRIVNLSEVIELRGSDKRSFVK